MPVFNGFVKIKKKGIKIKFLLSFWWALAIDENEVYILRLCKGHYNMFNALNKLKNILMKDGASALFIFLSLVFI